MDSYTSLGVLGAGEFGTAHLVCCAPCSLPLRDSLLTSIKVRHKETRELLVAKHITITEPAQQADAIMEAKMMAAAKVSEYSPLPLPSRSNKKSPL